MKYGENMERYAWHARVKEGFIEEYKKRHDDIWPEMISVLKEAGISNYSIYLCGHDLFGYYECEKGAAYAQEYQNKSDVVSKWNVYMNDILIWDDGEVQGSLEEVFRLD